MLLPKTCFTKEQNKGLGDIAQRQSQSTGLACTEALGSISNTQTMKNKNLSNVIPTCVKAFLSHILRCHNINHEALMLKASNVHIGLSLQTWIHRYL